MSARTSNELREAFLSYFESKKHMRERSSSLIPQNDPTLLFTNAGMVQFKDLFTGKERRTYTRATTSQKCVRAGGKHNDLEAVGFTRRHHTFFEMLGNFSFGDYFKKEAIEFAWEFLTGTLKFSSKDLWVSVFEKDDEAADLWHKISKLPKDRIVRMGEKDNFWAMGETGPCGPCSEIYVDRGERFGSKNETIFDGGERFLEIWNLVFMQFERFQDGTMKDLPKPSVDTGMGLERLASVVQGVDSNYLTDGMQSIVQGFAQMIGKKYGTNEADDVALRVLTDHIRAVSFLIADGVQPSNEGRGYVLRRILRRAIRYGKKLDMSKPFFHEGVDFVDKQMGAAYPEIKQNLNAIKKIIFHEEEKFFETLETGLKLLEQKTAGLSKGKKVAGEIAFQLYDTYGFPLDLTEVILREKGLELDHAGFDVELENQRARSKASWKGSGQEAVSEIYKELANKGLASTFTGYTSLEEKTKILGIVIDGKPATSLKAGEAADLVIEKCPFYAEGGGQVGDHGTVESSDAKFSVQDTRKPVSQFYIVQGKLEKGSLKVGDAVTAKVNRDHRMKVRINHTITHVLHATLQEVLGDHIKQAGSLVHADYLRFDFAHYQAINKEELRKIETIVNARIRDNSAVQTHVEDLDKAIAGGAKAFFDDKYSDKVRVLTVGGYSKELCGGTHAEYLGEAGLFKITSESSVASGVRRIVAVTGAKAYDYVIQQENLIDSLAELLKVPEQDLASRVEKLLKERADLQKKLQQQLVSGSSTQDEDFIKTIAGVKAAVGMVTVENVKDLRPISDRYKQKVKSGVVVVGAAVEGKATVIVAVTDDIAEQFGMNKFVDALSKYLGGKGGGKSNFAQVGGPEGAKLSDQALLDLTKQHLEGIQLVG